MSDAMINNLRVLLDCMQEHSSFVAQRMRDSGLPAEPLVAHSVAKYWDALEKLASE